MVQGNFIKQLHYEKWANEIVFEAIEKATNPDERVFELISHLVVSHHIWLKKLLNETPSFKSWEIIGLVELRQLNIENVTGWTDYLNLHKKDKISHDIHFNFFGSPSKISVDDLLIHLINHSSYHRGQIISKLKGTLETLPLTTYIAFATEKV